MSLGESTRPREIEIAADPLYQHLLLTVRWTAKDLAEASSVGVTTIRRAELSSHETSMTTANDLSVRRALEAAGVEFIDENGGGPGVRLKKTPRPPE